MYCAIIYSLKRRRRKKKKKQQLLQSFPTPAVDVVSVQESCANKEHTKDMPALLEEGLHWLGPAAACLWR